jgi:hypothetical protein
MQFHGINSTDKKLFVYLGHGLDTLYAWNRNLSNIDTLKGQSSETFPPPLFVIFELEYAIIFELQLTKINIFIHVRL